MPLRPRRRRRRCAARRWCGASGSRCCSSTSFGFADSYWQALLARGLALGLVLLSFTIVTGIGGMVSLAQAAFVTAAAFTAGWALSHGWPFLAALAAGTLVATALGVVVSLPARRLGGLPLALSTLALAFIAQYLFFQLDGFSNRTAAAGGCSRPSSARSTSVTTGR